jgi:hypothetical protein
MCNQLKCVAHSLNKMLPVTPFLVKVVVAILFQQVATTNLIQAMENKNEAVVSKAHIAREIKLTEKLVKRFFSKLGEETETGCRLWQAGKFSDGYGCFHIGKVAYKANRVAYMIYHGHLPVDLMVLHTCDTPECCAKQHLFLGTHQDNIDDMVKKGRQAKGERHFTKTKPERIARGERINWKLYPELVKRGDEHWTRRMPWLLKKGPDNPNFGSFENVPHGEKHHKAKVTEAQVREMRARYDAGGVTQTQLAKEYGIRQDVVSDIVKRRTWKCVV